MNNQSLTAINNKTVNCSQQHSCQLKPTAKPSPGEKINCNNNNKTELSTATVIFNKQQSCQLQQSTDSEKAVNCNHQQSHQLQPKTSSQVQPIPSHHLHLTPKTPTATDSKDISCINNELQLARRMVTISKK